MKSGPSLANQERWCILCSKVFYRTIGKRYNGVKSSPDYFDTAMDKFNGMLKAKPHKTNKGKIIVAIVILIAVILAGLWCLKYFL